MLSRRPRGKLGCFCLAALFSTACGGYPTPYSAESLERDSAGDPKGALLHYLSQRNADGRVCDANSRPRTQRMDAKVVKALVLAVERDQVVPSAAQLCFGLALEQLGEGERSDSLRFLGSRYTRSLKKDRSGGLHGLVMSGANRSSDAKALADAREEAESLVSGGQLSPTAKREAGEFVSMLGLLLGEWEGKRLDVDTIRAETDRDRLRLFAAKLPDPALAREATAQLVRLEARRSAYPEVVNDVEGVVARVVETGRNAVDLRSNPISSARFDDKRSRAVGLVMKQDPSRGEASLELSGGVEDRLVPTFDLKGWLWFDVEGISKPVTLCEAAEAFSPAPCIDARELRVNTDLMKLDENGLLALRDRLDTRDAIRLLGDQGGLDISVFFGPQPIARVALPFRFRTPSPFVRQNATPGGEGPNLVVDVGQVGDHLVFQVNDADRAYPIAVHRDGLSGFFIASKGGDGFAGRAGSDGQDGMDGRNGSGASCPGTDGRDGGDGGNGTRGGNGGPGGAGGNGGSVQLRVHCGKACADLKSSWPKLVRSLGGAGGQGGRAGQGGDGGRAGRGGMGTSCSVTTGYGDNKRTENKRLSGGMDGRRGSDGMDGMRGPNGPDGAAGRVRVVFE